MSICDHPIHSSVATKLVPQTLWHCGNADTVAHGVTTLFKGNELLSLQCLGRCSRQTKLSSNQGWHLAHSCSVDICAKSKGVKRLSVCFCVSCFLVCLLFVRAQVVFGFACGSCCVTTVRRRKVLKFMTSEAQLHWLLKSSRNPPTRSPTFPFSYLRAHRLAVNRQFWSKLVRLPTCKTLLTASSFSIYSQTVH